MIIIDNMKIISLGGTGGCHINTVIRSEFNHYYNCPYGWLYCSQSFIIDSFFESKNFFDFDNMSLFYNIPNEKTIVLRHSKKNAIMLHDFNGTTIDEIKNEIEAVNKKYNKRYERLTNAIKSDEPILFIRKIDMENSDRLNQYSYEKENISVWLNFIKSLNNKNVRLLLLKEVNQIEYDVYGKSIEDIIFIENVTCLNDWNEHIIKHKIVFENYFNNS
jgi:hypothetical protein